jgi:hypothetical protein
MGALRRERKRDGEATTVMKPLIPRSPFMNAIATPALGDPALADQLVVEPCSGSHLGQ